jgi:colanic acid/amylovoran biosynthesis glycosyltransferase
LRVAYLINQYPRTSHSFIRREILALEAEGIEVLRYSLRPLDEALPHTLDRQELARTRIVLSEGILGHAVAVAALGLRRPAALAHALLAAVRLGWRSDRGVLRHLVYLAEACVLARWLRRAEVDHLHAHFGTNSATVALLARELDGPTYSFTVHGPEEFDRPELLRLDQKVRRAAFAVAISSFGRAQLCRWIRFPDWAKVHVVRCGVGDDLLRCAPSPVPAAPRLVCVARLSEQKGHMILLDAAGRLAAEGVPFELALVGDGPLRGEIERRIAAGGLGGRVRVVGWLGAPEVREAILASRAVVLSSFAEGLPIVAMEALALGRPVVATSIAGIPELIQSGVSGWLVPAGSVEALADAMRDVLRASPAELERMGRAGAARVASQHDARVAARHLAQLFQSVLVARPDVGAEAQAAPSEGSTPKLTA